jgi:hypothetical protein
VPIFKSASSASLLGRITLDTPDMLSCSGRGKRRATSRAQEEEGGCRHLLSQHLPSHILFASSGQLYRP